MLCMYCYLLIKDHYEVFCSNLQYKNMTKAIMCIINLFMKEIQFGFLT